MLATLKNYPATLNLLLSASLILTLARAITPVSYTHLRAHET